MNKALISFGLVTTQFEKYGKDYFDNFVPFFATLFHKNNISKFNQDDIHQFSDLFLNEFGLKIPYHPILTILNRCKKRNLIKKKGSNFIVNAEVKLKFEFTQDEERILKRRQEILKSFTNFSDKEYQVKIDDTLAEDILLSVFQNNGLDFLFSRSDGSIIPEIKLPKCLKQYQYIFYRFVIKISKEVGDLYSSLIDLAFGHIISTTILVEDYHYDNDTIKNCDIFLDTSFILKVIGTDGKKMMVVYNEFIHTLYLCKANLKIFKHTLDEIYELLEGATDWINSPSYDFNKASRMLKHFKEEGYNRSQVELFIPKIQSVLKQYEIMTESKPDYLKTSEYQIDEQLLTEILEGQLLRKNSTIDLERYKIRTQRDVDSISAIYRFRKGNNPRYLREAKYCFLTTNPMLSLVNYLYKKNMKLPKSELPACLTDTFIGSILWLKEPKAAKNEIKNKFLADCYIAINPDEHLEKLLLEEAKRLKDHHEITEEDYILLSTTHLTKDFLNEETLNDPDQFQPTTTSSILEDIKEEILRKESEAHLETKKKLDFKEKESEILLEQNSSLKSILFDDAQKKAKLSNLKYYILIFGVILLPLPFIFIVNPWISLISIIGSIITAYFGLVKGFTFKDNYRIVYQKELKRLFEKHKIIQFV